MTPPDPAAPAGDRRLTDAEIQALIDEIDSGGKAQYPRSRLGKALKQQRAALAERDAEIGRLRQCLLAILAADERGQGQPFADAMAWAQALVGKPA